MIRRLTKAADHTVLIAVLAVSAAVVAAVIAAATATINQRRQLKHDRQMQDLTELRSVLDDAAIGPRGRHLLRLQVSSRALAALLPKRSLPKRKRARKSGASSASRASTRARTSASPGIRPEMSADHEGTRPSAALSRSTAAGSQSPRAARARPCGTAGGCRAASARQRPLFSALAHVSRTFAAAARSRPRPRPPARREQ
jgi:hypothetical protein